MQFMAEPKDEDLAGGEHKFESRFAFLDRPLVPTVSMVSSFIYL